MKVEDIHVELLGQEPCPFTRGPGLDVSVAAALQKLVLTIWAVLRLAAGRLRTAPQTEPSTLDIFMGSSHDGMLLASYSQERRMKQMDDVDVTDELMVDSEFLAWASITWLALIKISGPSFAPLSVVTGHWSHAQQ